MTFGQGPDDKEQKSLFAAPREVVLHYLESHRIPKYWYTQCSIPVELTTSSAREEVKKAADVFVKSDTEMRLAIAKAMDCFFDEGPRMWDACGPDDHETLHYLLPGLAIADEGKRVAEARKWLFEKAHPSLAAPLLRALCKSYYLLNDITEEDQKKVLRLLCKLYRQSGNMSFRFSGAYEAYYGPESGPISKYVIRALGKLKIPEAREQLIKWMIEDGKKSCVSVRQEMWSTFNDFKFDPWVKNSENILKLVRQEDIIELWLLTPPTHKGNSVTGMSILSGHNLGNDKVKEEFKKAVVLQLINPDSDVIEGLVQYLISQWGDKELLSLIQKVNLTVIAKKRIKGLLEKALQEYDWKIKNELTPKEINNYKVKIFKVLE